VKEMDADLHPEEEVALLREISEARGISLPQPLMLYIERPLHGSNDRRNPKKSECELVIVNSSKSITEALLIQASRALLESLGYKNTIVRVNSIGNKDSVTDFDRKTQNFIKKKIADFPPELREKLKKDPFYLIKSKEEKYKEWREQSPQSLDCLSEESRLHFKEVLEFLEVGEVPYAMDPSLVGDLSYNCETIFEIVTADGEQVLAKGSRWNRLSKKVQYKKEIPGVSVTISAKINKPQKITIIKEEKPMFYLVQFGPEAKLKCFIVIEKLRKIGITITHSLAKDKLTGQITSAESMNIPYIILLGQKEALENTVIIRNVMSRSQVSISIDELENHIKKIK
jgi:histidyl-tRNA synthetase